MCRSSTKRSYVRTPLANYQEEELPSQAQDPDSASARLAERAITARSPHNFKNFVLDDHHDIRRVANGRQGAYVVAYSNAVEDLEAVKTYQLDFVFCDIAMFEPLDQIRRRDTGYSDDRSS
jgi:hypothetical protein